VSKLKFRRLETLHKRRKRKKKLGFVNVDIFQSGTWCKKGSSREIWENVAEVVFKNKSPWNLIFSLSFMLFSPISASHTFLSLTHSCERQRVDRLLFEGIYYTDHTSDQYLNCLWMPLNCNMQTSASSLFVLRGILAQIVSKLLSIFQHTSSYSLFLSP